MISFAFVPSALTGGWLARPHDHFPDVFQNKFWTSYPYFLPCLVIASLAIFACFVAGAYLREVGPPKFH